jgi:uncharacterized membrane protein
MAAARPPHAFAHPETPSSALPWSAIVITAVLALVAAVFGFAASTADPVLIGMVVAAVAGLALLARPTWIITLTLVIGLCVVGLIPLWADAVASKAVWGVSVLGFCLLAAASVRAAAGHEALRHTPSFVWFALAFMLYAVVNGLLQMRVPMDFISGFKRYFSMWGLLFCLAWLALSDEQVSRWRRIFVAVALLQLPFAVYELVVFVPWRKAVAYAYSGMVPIDVVAGTFGAHPTLGGANAEMAAFLILAIAVVISRLKEKATDWSPRVAAFLLLSAIPLVLGETKIVVVIVPLLFIVLYRGTLLSSPVHGVVFLLAMLASVSLLAAAYLQVMGRTFEGAWKDLYAYNFGNVGYGGWRLNRTSVLTFWFDRQSWSDPVATVFGNGIGAAHDAGKPPGFVARRYLGMGIGLTSASLLLWEQGVAGLALYVSILAAAWRAAGLLAFDAREPWVRADAAAIQAAMPVFLLWLFYRTSMTDLVSIQIVFACSLGYLAWLWRREHLKPRPGR